ncbi:MAG: stage II sporulation protein D, partial [Bacillota bacterium]
MYRILIATLLLVAALLLGLPYLVNHARVSKGVMVRLFIHQENRIVELPLEEYLVGVVAAEMPAEFSPEALKAQAVAARTYTLRRLSSAGAADQLHPGADLCDDFRHGQAWLSRQELENRWGTPDYYRYYYKVKKAVDDTKGLVITYQGELIDPVYHASCGGKSTENAEDVWKFKEPYLRSVACPYDADPQPVQTKAVSLEIVDRMLGTNLMTVPAAGGAETRRDIRVLERTATGRPKTVRVGDKIIPATVMRDLLELRSTDFTWKIEGNRVVFTTRGYGHGAGLCQYGAK